MKKKTLLTSLAGCMLLCSLGLSAQTFKPTDKWPYIYNEFTSATLVNVGGKGDQEALVNICVGDNHIHYVRPSDEMILDMVSWNLKEIKIGAKEYLAVGSQVLEKILESEYGYVLMGKKIDYEAMSKVDIGYGISTSTFSAKNMDLSQLLIPGNVNQRVRNAMEAREYEQQLVVEDEYFVYDGKTLLKANKNDFVEMYGKNETTAFLKQNKIKWGQPASIIKVAEYMKANQAK